MDRSQYGVGWGIAVSCGFVIVVYAAPGGLGPSGVQARVIAFNATLLYKPIDCLHQVTTTTPNMMNQAISLMLFLQLAAAQTPPNFLPAISAPLTVNFGTVSANPVGKMLAISGKSTNPNSFPNAMYAMLMATQMFKCHQRSASPRQP
jgi:hypothetical protein